MRRFLLNDWRVRELAAKTIKSLPAEPLQEVIIRPARDSRNLEQNAALWAALTDVSEQVTWHGQKYSAEDWKEIFSAGWKTQRFAPGIEGGLVALGISTSRLTKEEFSELLDYIIAWGTENGVKFGTHEARAAS